MKKEQWQKLQKNDFIYSKTGTKREIIRISQKDNLTSCISLQPLRKTKFCDDQRPTVYCLNDCSNWFLSDPGS